MSLETAEIAAVGSKSRLFQSAFHKFLRKDHKNMNRNFI